MHIKVTYNAQQQLYNWAIFRDGAIPHWNTGKADLSETTTLVEDKFPGKKITFIVS